MGRRSSVPTLGNYQVQSDTVFGILTQGGPGTAQKSDAFTAAGDVRAGLLFIAGVKCSGTGPNFPIATANAPFKFSVINTVGIMSAAGDSLDTVNLTDGTTAITDVADVSALLDTAVFRAATISDATQNIAAAGTLQVTTADSAAADVYVYCLRVK